MIQAYNGAPSSHDVFEGLRVAITGGTRGLGLALVQAFTAAGAQVAFVARDAHDVERVAAGTGAFGIVGDVAQKTHIHAIALQVIGFLGGLDLLINNASSLGPPTLRPLADTECEALELALATNVLGPFRLTKALLGALAASAGDRSAGEKGRGGITVNISSDAAMTPYPNWGAYGASKAALHHLTRIWNEELASEGVRLLSIDPGDMDTALHAQALPDADPATLERPENAARGVMQRIAAVLAPPTSIAGARHASSTT